ncbi:MAG: 2-oxoacid:acceptor oxidoreductase family protein [Muribaculaceae bacterium]|nr:2-oxoacid:acceptor oxidoreductase family protein [Muribaculaceae bacterium]MCI6494738.1 2-oxoacid:acceptor oxidoreductase family protein [Bacteroidales bacterium]MDD6702231.1 2-oxoacid:acceptor oxidoreductase family protein [Bacteroidales bacterium]MDD6943637.1 2-oxoacid:acceptor oxidoreductase family protein [Bacteroidales bacterium]MDY2734280.1 2-oxoacid:acceptor oxidoreductase family protein [Muribaculaceae bacterium]
MKEEIIIAGFGGQGVLSMGKILAYSGLMDDKEVTWMPSYGPEQRGGTANVTVILSDAKISSPVLDKYDIVVALNQQSLDKFAPKVKAGGILIFDTNGIHNRPTRDDIKIYPIDAMEATLEIGNSKAYNMVVMGALLKAMTYKLPMENVIKGLKKSLPERHHKLIPLNEKAIEKGASLI